MSTQHQHPTAGRCKRCGAELPRLWIPHPFRDGEMIAERWCSDECYAVELRMDSAQACRANRMRGAAGAERGEGEAA